MFSLNFSKQTALTRARVFTGLEPVTYLKKTRRTGAIPSCQRRKEPVQLKKQTIFQKTMQIAPLSQPTAEESIPVAAPAIPPTNTLAISQPVTPGVEAADQARELVGMEQKGQITTQQKDQALSGMGKPAIVAARAKETTSTPMRISKPAAQPATMRKQSEEKNSLEDLFATIDLQDENFKKGLKEAALVQGVKEAFADGIVKELGVMQLEKESREKRFLAVLEEELLKVSSLLETPPYSIEEIKEITSSVSNLEKAASLEAAHTWDGIVDQLRKEGADESFIQGMEKEAGLFDILKLAPTLAKAPVNAARAGWNVLRRGQGATEEALRQAAKTPGAGGLVNQAGEVLTHAPTVTSHLPGVRTSAFVNEFRNLAGNKLTPQMHTSLDIAGRNAAQRSTQALQRQGENVFQSHIHDISRAAHSGDVGAQNVMKQISEGDLSGVAKRMNLDFDKSTKINPAVIQDAKTHAAEAVGAGFNPAKVKTPYSSMMNPEVAAGAPNNTGMFRFTPGKGLAHGLTGATIGSLAGPAGTIAGGLGGLATGTLGLGGAALAGGAGLLGAGYLGGKALGMLGGRDTDIEGNKIDRNRIFSPVSNRILGMGGGALLGHLLAQQLGLQGPAAWLLPILGGMGGKSFLPHLINKWKDPYGEGVNSIPLARAQSNRANLYLPQQ